jgi:hypothetical protein
MDTLAVIFEGLRIFFGFFLVLFLPGFTISLVYYPRSTDLSLIDRLVYSTILSVGSVMVSVLFMKFVLGENTTPRNIALFICVLCEIALCLWWCERWYLNSRSKNILDPRISAGIMKKLDAPKHLEFKFIVAQVRKLQKEIVRERDMFSITPDSFDTSKKNIEHIRIPQKSDVDKKLAEVEDEMHDLDWLYE